MLTSMFIARSMAKGPCKEPQANVKEGLFSLREDVGRKYTWEDVVLKQKWLL